jgi:probable HAF family extracellular repeat protein
MEASLLAKAGFVLALGVLSLSASVAAPLFRITDLGKLSGSYATTASDMNDDTTITGDPDDPFVWTPQAGLAEPPRMPDGTGFAPTGINNAGDMVGKEWDGLSGRAFMRRADGSFIPILKGTALDVVDPIIRQITNSGKVLGATFSNLEPYPLQPWVWSESTGPVVFAIATREDVDVQQMNDRDQLVGAYEYDDFPSRCSSQRAFWRDLQRDKFAWLDHGPRKDWTTNHWCGHVSVATAINNAGQVVGYGNTFDKPFRQAVQAFIWTEDDGLQPLGPRHDPRMKNLKPGSINESGQVVGTFEYSGTRKQIYFYWDKDSGVLDLQEMLDPDDPLAAEVILQVRYLDHPPPINNRGQIAVGGKLRSDPQYGHFRDPTRTFLLTPVAR